MKKIWNILKGIIIGIWVVAAIFTTVCLISFNDYSITEFGKTTLLIIDNDELEPEYKENDLVILKKSGQSKYEVGDKVFFYQNNKDREDFVSCAKITAITKNENAEYSYSIDESRIPYGDVLGKVNGSTKIGTVGLILSIMESRWGYMFLVILPTLFLFVYEIYAIVMEIKKDVKEELEKED